MSWLLDVNLILASRWTTHPDHLAAALDGTLLAKPWAAGVAENPLVQMARS
jgi:hypothetical protein